MRKRVSAVLVAMLVSALSPAMAQKFQEPAKEELQMTSDPKAPGAPAVFLYLEQKTDNANHYTSEYARIKVLTEHGKEWATVEVPYDPETASPPIVEARTIHPDGTVVPLSGKGSDVLALKSVGQGLKTAVFRFPSPTVGSILEYRWAVPLTKGKLNFIVGDPYKPLYQSLMAKQTPTWNVQRKIFIHKASFYFNPFTPLETGDRDVLKNETWLTGLVYGERANNLLFTERLPAGSHVAKTPKGEYFLEVQDVSAIPMEPNAPPVSSLAYQVQFYFSPYAFEDVYWNNEIKRLSKLLDHWSEPTASIREAVGQLIVGVDSPEAKARKLYDAVQAVRNSGVAPPGSNGQIQSPYPELERKTAEQVWEAKNGTSNDLAILYLALARAAGLPAYGIEVTDRSQRIFDPKYLSLGQLDSTLVMLHLDGKDIYLDPGEKFCAFGQLHWSHTLSGGISGSSKALVYTPPNDLKDAITARRADLAVDPLGQINGTVDILMNGPEALRWRQLNLTSDISELRKHFGEDLQCLLPKGVTAEVTGMKGLDTSAGYVAVSLKVSGTIGTTTGKRLFLPGFFFSGALSQFVSPDKRETPVDLHYAEQVIDDVIYHLPAGYAVEAAPHPAQLLWPEHATLVVKTQPGPDTIEIKHIFARAFVLLDPKEYPALRDYYQKIATNDQQQVVLAPAAAAGN